MFFFLSKLITPGVLNYMKPYGGDYFSFVIIGIALTDYLSVSLSSFSSQIRTGQMMGTLESLLVTPTSVSNIIFSSSLYNFLFTSFRIILYITIGTLFFGLNIFINSLFSIIIIIALTILVFSSIGLLSASFIIVFKQGSPISWLMGISAGLLGGVFYPVSVLPEWLKPLSFLLPITHSLEAMRRILLHGATLFDVYNEILILTIFAIFLLPAGLLSFGYGLRFAKKEGTLTHY